MKKNSVWLKEVLTLVARAPSRASVADSIANTTRDIDDVRKTRAPKCQQ